MDRPAVMVDPGVRVAPGHEVSSLLAVMPPFRVCPIDEEFLELSL